MDLKQKDKFSISYFSLYTKFCKKENYIAKGCKRFGRLKEVLLIKNGQIELICVLIDLCAENRFQLRKRHV